MESVLITNDAVVLGVLAMILGAVFYTSQSEHPACKALYKYVPALLLCYFIPSLLNTFNIVDGDASKIYYVASRYLLPACLVLLLLNLDLKAILGLGPKAIVMFLTGTVGIIIGGPIALMVMAQFSPEMIGVDGPETVWRGMTTVAGSWIGGGANQAAMKEIYEVGGDVFSAMVTVDIIVANLWMAVLLLMAGNARKIDASTGADTSAIERLKDKMNDYHAQNDNMASTKDLMGIVAVGFGVTALGHVFADIVTPFFVENFPETKRFSFHSKFFWLIISSTAMGVALSFTRARKLESVGASKVGTVYLYILIASIGLHMDVTKIAEAPKLFILGGIWMLVHATLMLTMAKIIKAPLFYMAVGSQANVGGAASAPVVASAFHPALAPVGVLLAIFGYLVGTFGAWLCGQILMTIAL